MTIYCVECEKDIEGTLTSGKEIYPTRSDLHQLPFWKCDDCNNYVGCHHKTDNPTNPLGCIPNEQLREARKHIHKLMDPIWESNAMNRKYLYNKMSKMLGYKYHTAGIESIEQAREVYKTVLAIKKEKNV